MQLGHIPRFLGERIGHLLENGAYPHASTHAEARRRYGVAKLQADLFSFYASSKDKSITQVQRLDVQMFGKPGQGLCRLHGGETNGFLAFGRTLIARFGGYLDKPAVWATCCDHLLKIRDICKLRHVPPSQHQD